MEVRLKIGRYAGEIQDVAPDVAKRLIESGQATDPRSENGSAPKPAKKKKGSR